jgi:phage N-6-adenine-methyltransferase
MRGEQKPHVARNTGKQEWYTPPEYIAAAKAVLGTIELDPASSSKAQVTVQADRYYTKDSDGLAQDWSGKIWLNPPYAAGLVDKFIAKLLSSDFTEAIVLVNNATETVWFQQMARRASAMCFPKGRVRFLDAVGKPGTPLQGQAVIYLGDKPHVFKIHFSQFGLILGALA